MAILVTGGAGYIGTNVVKHLIEKGEEVVVIDNLSTGFLDNVTQFKIPLYVSNISDIRYLKMIFKKHDIKEVIHLAGSSIVAESMTNPGKYYANNVAETLNLLEAMVLSNVKSIIFSSSAAVYGANNEGTCLGENSKKEPSSVYGETKLIIERMLKFYSEQFNLKSTSLRYFNACGADASAAFGEQHNPETHLIPIVLNAAKNNTRIKVFGNNYMTVDGTCIRDYIHVTDLATAHYAALIHSRNHGTICRAFNIGTGNGYSVLDIIKTAEEVTGLPIHFDICERREGDPAILVARPSKAKIFLKWEPEHSSLKNIIKTAWDWHNKE